MPVPSQALCLRLARQGDRAKSRMKHQEEAFHVAYNNGVDPDAVAG